MKNIETKIKELKEEIITEIKRTAGGKYINVCITTRDPEDSGNVEVFAIGGKVATEEYTDLFELENFHIEQLKFFLDTIKKEIEEDGDLVGVDSIYMTEEEVFDYLDNSV
jgi:hypothetical protein